MDKTYVAPADQCSLCRFFRTELIDMRTQTTCRRHPPRVQINFLPGPGGQVQQVTSATFPPVAATAWCGEFEAKPATVQ